jgi:hypothetical protein
MQMADEKWENIWNHGKEGNKKIKFVWS